MKQKLIEKLGYWLYLITRLFNAKKDPFDLLFESIIKSIPLKPVKRYKNKHKAICVDFKSDWYTLTVANHNGDLLIRIFTDRVHVDSITPVGSWATEPKFIIGLINSMIIQLKDKHNKVVK